jgi:ABC-type lipopolysaccharide export system ATPase subunit
MITMPGYVVTEKDEKSRAMLLGGLTQEASRTLTVCEQLRFVYDTVYQIPDKEIRNDLTEKLVDAFNMAKKMNSRLAHYKRKYIDKTGHRGKSLIRLEHTKEREELRRNRA